MSLLSQGSFCVVAWLDLKEQHVFFAMKEESLYCTVHIYIYIHVFLQPSFLKTRLGTRIPGRVLSLPAAGDSVVAAVEKDLAGSCGLLEKNA